MSDVPYVPVASTDFYKNNGVDHPGVDPGGPSMTRQEFADDCDINVLMRRYENQDIGAIMRRNLEPSYVDFTSVPSDLMGTLAFMDEAESAFMTLPATVRRSFDNNAHEFVSFAVDPGNLDQMRSWGLAPPVAAPAPSPSPLSPQGTSAQAGTGAAAGDPPKAP